MEKIIIAVAALLVALYDLFGNNTYKNGGTTHKTHFKDYKDQFRTYDIALNPGITFWYGQFGAELCWERGLISWDDHASVFSNDFKIRLAYRF